MELKAKAVKILYFALIILFVAYEIFIVMLFRVSISNTQVYENLSESTANNDFFQSLISAIFINVIPCKISLIMGYLNNKVFNMMVIFLVINFCISFLGYV